MSIKLKRTQIRKIMEGKVRETPPRNPLASHHNNSLEIVSYFRRNLIILRAIIVCEKRSKTKSKQKNVKNKINFNYIFNKRE